MEYSFEDFKIRAQDNSLSKWEKIGFPDSYRINSEQHIFEDIYRKLNLNSCNSILDIGCGCSDLANRIIDFSKQNLKELYLVDSEEMLANIDSNLLSNNIHLTPGKFPEASLKDFFKSSKFDGIIVYSVIQYVYLEQSIFTFIHECINLLNPGGRLLLGDIPNYEKRERFLNSDAGVSFLNNSSFQTNSVSINHTNEERLDDSIVLAILHRFRNFGCETYLLPQPNELPFSNRREDILIIKR